MHKIAKQILKLETSLVVVCLAVSSAYALECDDGWHLVDVKGSVDKIAGIAGGYTDNLGVFSDWADTNKGADYYNITESRTWSVSYGSSGFLYGHGYCSALSGVGMWNGASNPSNVSTTIDFTDNPDYGANCWCNVSEYKDNQGQLHPLSSVWVYRNFIQPKTYDCDSVCARYCLYGMLNVDSQSLGFRNAVFNAMDEASSTVKCVANIININWIGAETDDISVTSVSYNGDIKTPLKAVEKTGKRFLGWKFVKPE